MDAQAVFNSFASQLKNLEAFEQGRIATSQDVPHPILCVNPLVSTKLACLFYSNIAYILVTPLTVT